MKQRILELEKAIFEMLCAQYEPITDYERSLENLKAVFLKGVDGEYLRKLKDERKT